MTHDMLLPSRFRRIGWIILVPAALAGIFLSLSGYEAEWISGNFLSVWSENFPEKEHFLSIYHGNLTNTIVAALFLIGALLVAFSREKVEDEYIRETRLSSLMWAVWVNYGLLLLAILFVYGLSFLNVMVFNMFTVLIIFIARYQFLIYRNNKAARHEK